MGYNKLNKDKVMQKLQEVTVINQKINSKERGRIMEAERLLNMDPYIALSWMNTKLRNEFETLEALCKDVNIESYLLVEKMAKVGYIYELKINQWTSMSA